MRLIGPLRQLTIASGLKAELLRGSVGTAAAKACYMACQFLTGVILARALGPSGLGIYALAISMAQLLAIAAQFGLPGYLVRTVAIGPTGPLRSVTSLIIGAAEIVFAISAILITVVALLTWGLGISLVDLPPSSLLSALVLVPVLALSATLSGVLRGLGHVIRSQLATEVTRPVLLLVMVGGFYLLSQGLSPRSALLLNGLALTVATASLIHSLLKCLPAEPIRRLSPAGFREVVRGGLPFILLAGAQSLNYQADIVTLGILSTSDQVGIYRVALQIADGMGVVLFAISLTTAPYFARLYASGDRERLQKLLVYAHRAAFAVITPLVLILIFISGQLLNIIFGAEYVAATEALAVLCVGKIFYATVCYSGVVLSMTGRTTSAAIISLGNFGLNLALNVVLIPLFGTVGAATATAVSEFLINAIGLAYLYKATGISGFIFSRVQVRSSFS